MVGSSKDTGSTWVYNHHETGKWPVVICHDELAPKKFISKRKERRWLAAIQLGRHKFCWVTDESLEPYDPNDSSLILPPHEEIKEDDSDDVVMEKSRRLAFNQEAKELHDDKFWAAFLRDHSKAANLQKRLNETSPNQPLSKKRKVIRDDESDTFPDFIYDRGTIPESSSSPHSPELTNSPLALIPTGPLSDECRILLTSPGGTLDSVNLNLSSIRQCHYLTSRLTQDKVGECPFIDLTADERAQHLSLTTTELNSITEFFQQGGMLPPPAPSPHDTHDLLRARNDACAARIAPAFLAAVKIQHQIFQDLLYQKLCALRPLSLQSVLLMAGVLAELPAPETPTHANLARKIARRIRTRFWVIVREDPDALRGVLERDDGLRKAVYAGLARDGREGSRGLGG